MSSWTYHLPATTWEEWVLQAYVEHQAVSSPVGWGADNFERVSRSSSRSIGQRIFSRGSRKEICVSEVDGSVRDCFEFEITTPY